MGFQTEQQVHLNLVKVPNYHDQEECIMNKNRLFAHSGVLYKLQPVMGYSNLYLCGKNLYLCRGRRHHVDVRHICYHNEKGYIEKVKNHNDP